MSYSPTIDMNLIQQWFIEKLDPKTLEQKLHEKGWDQETVLTHLKEYRKLCCAKRQFTGFMFLGAGAFLGFISCLLSVFNPIPSLYYPILYGLTSIAIGLLFYGLYLVFEG